MAPVPVHSPRVSEGIAPSKVGGEGGAEAASTVEEYASRRILGRRLQSVVFHGPIKWDGGTDQRVKDGEGRWEG